MQQDKNLELFSTKIFVFKFTNKEMEPLINEVLRKKEEIKKRSLVFSNHGGIGDYHTDYRNPIQLHEYEKLMYSMANHFNNFNVNLYWTAFYNKNSLHDEHKHANFIRGTANNFSSILYLSAIGGTTFYSPNLTSTEDEFYCDSEVGKFVIFPSNLLHKGENRQDGERIIISSNIQV
tara:strand:+ start:1119 stop:1649 length:531 start_codon:yes stop_codon:yes gene_type:complete